VFTVASLGATLSGNLWVLVVFRFLQAVGAAVLTPRATGSCSPRRLKLVQIWSAGGSLAAAAGPVVGGLLVAAAWQWIFLLNTDTRLPDLPGGSLLVVAIGALALGLVHGPEWSWGSGATIGSFAVAAAALARCLFRLARHPVPVVDLRHLRRSGSGSLGVCRSASSPRWARHRASPTTRPICG
jgi:MFS family permease